MLLLLQLLCIGNKTVNSVGSEIFNKFSVLINDFLNVFSYLRLISNVHLLVKKGSFTRNLTNGTYTKYESVFVNYLVYQELTNNSKHFVAILCCILVS